MRKGFMPIELCIAGPILLLILVAVAGWISNIVQVVHLAQANDMHAIFWVKCIAILVAPVGTIMGIVGWF